MIDSSTALISNNTFTHSVAETGGAILIINSEATVEKNLLLENLANKGGALAFQCAQYDGCSLSLLNNTFQANNATEGVAVHYNMIRPSGLKDNNYVNNIAEYGQNYASFPAFIETPDDSVFKDIASGQQLQTTLVFRLLDFDRQVIINDN